MKKPRKQHRPRVPSPTGLILFSFGVLCIWEALQ